MDIIDGSVMVVSQQKRIRTYAKNSAGTSFDLAILEEPCNKILRLAVIGIETHHAISSANLRTARPVQSDQERVGQFRIP
jgi:hypothetical protein